MKLILISLFFLNAYGASEDIFTDKSKTTKITFCPQAKCLAQQAHLTKEFKTYKPIWKKSGDNPSSGLCKHLNGNAEIGIFGNDDEVSLCRFSDGSVALGWDLINKWQSAKDK